MRDNEAAATVKTTLNIFTRHGSSELAYSRPSRGRRSAMCDRGYRCSNVRRGLLFESLSGRRGQSIEAVSAGRAPTGAVRARALGRPSASARGLSDLHVSASPIIFECRGGGTHARPRPASVTTFLRASACICCPSPPRPPASRPVSLDSSAIRRINFYQSVWIPGDDVPERTSDGARDDLLTLWLRWSRGCDCVPRDGGARRIPVELRLAAIRCGCRVPRRHSLPLRSGKSPVTSRMPIATRRSRARAWEAATTALEEIRRSLGPERSVFTLWNTADDAIGRAGAGALQAVLGTLRDRIASEVVERLKQGFQNAFASDRRDVVDDWRTTSRRRSMREDSTSAARCATRSRIPARSIR